jgi:hypothetical protein
MKKPTTVVVGEEREVEETMVSVWTDYEEA